RTYAGRLAFDRGAYGEAAESLELALDLAPEDHGTLGELARVRAAEGEVGQAIELLERANELLPEPDHLVLLGDLRTLAGDNEAARADYRAAVELATSDADHRRAWARSLASYHLDHDGDLGVAAELVAEERAVRHDVGSHDLAAWLAFRQGDLVAARDAIDAALALGPTDAVVWYHAAAISAAEGDRERAAAEIASALRINPAFHPLLSIEAQRLATTLGVG
ncbi:MAG: tetratricopeptide repeat protein, partial [Actinomycetota bacterium]